MPNDREQASIKTYAIAGAVLVILCFIAIGVFLPPWGDNDAAPQNEPDNVAPVPTDGLSNEERAIVKAKLVSVLADADRAKEVIAELRREVADWETSILPLKTSDEGRPLREAAFKRRFEASLSRPKMTARDVETASEQLQIYREPIQKEVDSESYAHDHERASSKIKELLTKVAAELATYKAASSDIKRLLVEASGAKPKPLSPLQPGTTWAGYYSQTPAMGQAVFPMKLIVKTNSAGDVTGELHWPSIGFTETVMTGKLDGDRFSFTETAYVKRPRNGFTLSLNGRYTGTVSKNSLAGSSSGNGVTAKFELIRLPSTAAEKAERENRRNEARKKAQGILEPVFAGDADAKKKSLSMAMHFERWHKRRVQGMIQTQDKEWLPFLFWYQTLVGVFKKPVTTQNYPVRWEVDDWAFKGDSSAKTYQLYRAFEKVAKECPDLFQDTFVTAQAEATSGSVPVNGRVTFMEYLTIEHGLKAIRELFQDDAAEVRRRLADAKKH